MSGGRRMNDGYAPMDIKLYRWESRIRQISDSQVKYGRRGKQERKAIQRSRCGYKGISEGSWSKCVSRHVMKKQHKPEGLVFTWPTRTTEMLNLCGARNTKEGIDPLLGGGKRMLRKWQGKGRITHLQFCLFCPPQEN